MKKRRYKALAAALAAIMAVSATACAANTAQTNPIPESDVSVSDENSVTESTESIDSTDSGATDSTVSDTESATESKDNAESKPETTKANSDSKPATTPASTKPADKPVTTKAAETTKAATKTTTKATTTKKQSTTPAPSTTKATTTTKKQNTSPKPAETTKRQGATPTVDKTPVQEPTEEEIWDKMSAAEKREYFDHMAERIAYYLGVHRGNTEIILLPGLSNYAYERTQQVKRIGGGHSAENCDALAAELKYGFYYQKGEVAGVKKGWNSPGASEAMMGPSGYNADGFVGFSEESIDKEANQIIQDFSESAGHWMYLGDAKKKYVGVGYSEGGIIILVSNENCDLISEKTYEYGGDADLFYEKVFSGELVIA